MIVASWPFQLNTSIILNVRFVCVVLSGILWDDVWSSKAEVYTGFKTTDHDKETRTNRTRI